MSDILYDSRNYRVHTEENKKLIKNSLDECGAGRSILLDNENNIIAGNGLYEAWGKRAVKIIETDGTELIVVKRVDLKTTDEKRKKMAVYDNSTGDSSHFDIDLIKVDFEIPVLQSLGVPAFDTSFVDTDSFFEKKEENKKKYICSNCGREFYK